MTKQEYYNLLVHSAYNGTFPSISLGDCMYRADGTSMCKQRCAVGLLIPDDKYKSCFEGASASEMVRFGYVTMPSGITDGDLNRIQRRHDHIAKASTTWDPVRFIDSINGMRCFDDVGKVFPPNISLQE